jgi:protein-disulfide isomerase
MAKKILIVVFALGILFLGFSVGRFTNVVPTSKASAAAKENAEFKKLDDAQQAIALAVAAASPTIAKEVIANLEKKGDLPREAFGKVLELARAVGAGGPQAAAQKPQGPTVEDVLKDVKEVTVTPGAYATGKKDAKIKMVLFTELMCPFCGRVDPVVRDLQKEYGPDKIELVFQTKLIHGERAAYYHHAAYAAGKQNKFWEFAGDLFGSQQEWAQVPQEEAFDKVITPRAKKLGLNLAKLKKDMDSDDAKKWVDAENANAEKMGVQGTPTVFINGHAVRGARDKDFFKQVIDALLK